MEYIRLTKDNMAGLKMLHLGYKREIGNVSVIRLHYSAWKFARV